MALFIRSDHSQDFVQSAGQGGFSPLCCSLPAGRCRTDGFAVAFDCLGAAVVLRRSLLPARPLLNAPFCDARHFCTRNNPGIFQSPPVCDRYGHPVRRRKFGAE
jgi:hypothetical protein